MKNATFLFFLISTFGATLMAQSAAYVPMLGEKSGGWYEYNDYGFKYGGTTTLMIYQVGDTLIDGQTYIRLKSDRYSYTKDTTYTEDIVFMREDTDQRRVYLLSQDIHSEILFYDFSRKVGDTIILGIGYSGALFLNSINNTVIVCGDTIHTENRVFHFTQLANDSPITWIEGVGAISGLDWTYDESDFGCKPLVNGLICKMTDDSIVYHFDKFMGFKNCPFELRSSNHQKPEELTLRLYPNPVNFFLRISGDPGELGHARYRIFNLTGQIHKTGFLDYSRETVLDVSNLPGGVYIAEIYNENKNLLTNKKFVVAK